MIQLSHISKNFGPLAALHEVSLDILPGSILGLLGENGAGKSTLMHILFGLLRPDAGAIRINNHPVIIRTPRDAFRHNIGMVHQHFKLVPTLTALENLALFLRQRPAGVQVAAAEWVRRLSWQLALDVAIERLAVGQQQRVEILKALMMTHQDHDREGSSAPTLILDEPTAVLTPQEADELFTAVRTLKAAGAAIVFISHKLAEVQKICDKIAILRRGKNVWQGPAAELTADQIAEKMVGSRIEMPAPRIGHEKSQIGNSFPPQLVLNAVRTTQLKNVSLSIRPGEILGIAGVDGNGQSEIIQAILGTMPLRQGTLQINAQNAAHESTRDRLNHIAFIAEDRQREALVLPLSIEENLLLKDYRTSKFNTLGWLRFRAWRSHSKELMRQFDIRANSPTDPAGKLSGGNQQKVVIARELSQSKPIVLAVNPTRGLDVGATAFVLDQLLAARRRGAGILLIHSDLDELLAISDRIAVLYNGTLTQTNWPNASKEEIGKLMLGLSGFATGTPGKSRGATA